MVNALKSVILKEGALFYIDSIMQRNSIFLSLGMSASVAIATMFWAPAVDASKHRSSPFMTLNGQTLTYEQAYKRYGKTFVGDYSLLERGMFLSPHFLAMCDRSRQEWIAGAVEYAIGLKLLKRRRYLNFLSNTSDWKNYRQAVIDLYDDLSEVEDSLGEDDPNKKMVKNLKRDIFYFRYLDTRVTPSLKSFWGQKLDLRIPINACPLLDDKDYWDEIETRYQSNRDKIGYGHSNFDPAKTPQYVLRSDKLSAQTILKALRAKYGYYYIWDGRLVWTLEREHEGRTNTPVLSSPDLSLLSQEGKTREEILRDQLIFLLQERNSSKRERSLTQVELQRQEELADCLWRLNQKHKPFCVSTVLYTDKELKQWAKTNLKKLAHKRKDINVVAIRAGTEEVASKIKKGENDKVAIWVYTDPTKLGGGVLNGQNAQEECTGRSYASLPALTQDDFALIYYQHSVNEDLYAPELFYLKGVQHVDGSRADLICKAMFDNHEQEYEVSEHFIEKTVSSVFLSAIQNNVDWLVIGPGGNGVFGLDVKKTSKALASCCHLYGHHFKGIVFHAPGWIIKGSTLESNNGKDTLKLFETALNQVGGKVIRSKG